MSGQSKLSQPATITSKWGTVQIDVTIVVRDKPQPNPAKIYVERFTKFSEFKKHIEAKHLKGSLYIDGKRCDHLKGTKLLQLQTSIVEIKQTRPLNLPPTFQVSVDSQTFSTELKGLTCYSDTTLGELKFLIQDRIGVPADEISFKRKVGKELKKVRLDQVVVSFNPSTGMGKKGTSKKGTDKKGTEKKDTGKLVLIHECKKIKILGSVPEEPMTNRGLAFASEKVGSWKVLAEKGLGLEEPVIDAIESDFKVDGRKEQRYQALLMWRQFNDNKATWRALVRACCLIKNMEVAKRIADACK